MTPEEKKKVMREEFEIVTSVELEGGLVSMCNLSEAIWEKSMKQGIQQGIQQEKLEIAIKLYHPGWKIEDIAGIVGVSAEILEEKMVKQM